MHIVEININELRTDINNPRTTTNKQIDIYKNLFAKFGQLIPIIVDERNCIVYENGKLEALKELGIEIVKVVRIKDLTEDQIQIIRLAEINAIESGVWDYQKLFEELQKLGSDIAEITGFDLKEIESLIPENMECLDQIEEIEIPDIEEKSFSKQGDIYLLGDHRLMCGDSTNIDDVQTLMAGEKANLMITDPPYNIDYEGSDGQKIKNDNMTSNEFYEFLKKFYKNAYEVMEEGASYYIFHADSETKSFRGALEEANFKFSQCLIWVKNGFNLSRQDYNWKHEPCLYGWKPGKAHYFIKDYTQDTILEEESKLHKLSKKELLEYIKKIIDKNNEYCTIVRENKPLKNDIHPTMKPVRLTARLMVNSSRPKSKIVDLFGGSGTTLVTSEQLERVSFSMEYDPKYVDVIIKRYFSMDKEDIKLIRDGKEYTWEEIKQELLGE